MASGAPNVRELLELERQIYQESIDRVLLQQEKLNSGVLEDFVGRCKPFEQDRERELEVAQTQLQFSLSDAQTLLVFNLQQAENVYKTQREQLKVKLLESTKRRRAKIEMRLKALDEKTSKEKSNFSKKRHIVDVQKNGNLQEKLLEEQLQRAQKKARKSFNFRHLKGVLPTPDRIVNDVMEETERFQRYREREEAVKIAEEGSVDSLVHVETSGDGRTLSCRGENEVENTFAVGEEVMLTSQLTEEDFLGFVSAITSEEVKLMLVCGTHVRVGLDRLRSGQCVLHKQPTENRGGENGEDQINIPSDVAISLEGLLRDPPDVRRRAAAVLNRLKRKTTIDIRRGF
ncbi:hypothetical protein V7S43_016914 [Phytophthora oleae]|uniref:Uncharacterized protein n=1 Tax=Phytophthora oleae TaxID=2107226 RepID=A0ABD3EVS5_9STRA